MAAVSARSRRGSGPNASHAASVTSATATTAGTKTAAIRSASRWTGALVVWASRTIRTIRASAVWLPTRVASMTKAASPLTVAPITGSPGDLATGTDSPVTIDSSIEVVPSRITPSVGSFSPGRTRRRSPTRISPAGISTSAPSLRTRALFAAREASARIASPAFPFARSSRYRPRRRKAMMTTAAS